MKRITVLLTIWCAVVFTSVAPAELTATVTAAVNDVTRGSAQEVATERAEIGSKLVNGQYLKTGANSRAELQLANLAITRLGADTLFDYTPGANEIDLKAGTVLFSKPKDSAIMTIKTAAVTAAVLGTTGFVHVHGKTFVFGLLEGHAKVTVNGMTYMVGAGDILHLSAGSPPQMFAYNVPHFLETSPLIVDFDSKLPNQSYIDREVAHYDNLVARGFITPPTGHSLSDVEGAVPSVSTVAFDSASEAHYLSNVQNSPPVPPILGATGQVVTPARAQLPVDY